MTSVYDKVCQYYSDVDQSTFISDGHFITQPDVVSRILHIFAHDSIYHRQGWVSFVGKNEIQDFFATQRSLVGVHKLTELKEFDSVELGANPMPPHLEADPNRAYLTIAVQGLFTGNLVVTSGVNRKILELHEVNLSFTDYWVSQAGEIKYRLSEIRQLQQSDLLKT